MIHRQVKRTMSVALGVVALGALLTASASAQTAYTWVKTATAFNGADAIGTQGAPAFGYNGLNRLAIDQQSDALYAQYEGVNGPPSEQRLYKFDLAGASQPF